MKYISTIIGLCIAVVAAGSASAAAEPEPQTQLAAPGKLRAFPGAEGFGAWTPGGRGGKVYVVTNLQDYNPRTEQPIAGSFRAAVEASGPRMVVFAVSGNIDLKASIILVNPYLTIAGQTSPGGICLRYYELEVKRSAHDIIMRYIRWRPGDISKQQNDGISLSGARNVIFDHISASWANDEVLSATRDNDYWTLQWSIVAEAMHKSYHGGGRTHGLGSLIDSPHASYHHNLYAHNSGRNPRPGDCLLDWRNNVIYNWNNRAGYTGSDNVLRMNYVNNYLKAGPNTAVGRDIAFVTGGETRIFMSGNFMPEFPNKSQEPMLIINDEARVESQPFKVEPVATDTAQEAYEKVLAGVGATKPFRDAADVRVIQTVRDGTGAHIDSQNDVGGWPEMKNIPAPQDSDSDGMPDEWEKTHGLNPNDASDASQLAKDGSGYTNLENYINSL
jgi:pectate lyase